MSKHTPGPWECVPMLTASENHKGFFVRAAKPDGRGLWALATVQPGDQDGRLGHANAALIAAAPDLYEELRRVVEWMDAPDESAFSDADIARARFALAKAEGRQ